MGDGRTSTGAAQVVLSRDQHDPDGPLVRARVSRTYQRTAYALQVLTLRDEDGVEQTLRVTEEHPFFVRFGGWTPAKSLEARDTLLGADGTLTVVANEHEAHPQGVTVYNLEVERAHTYFVLAADAQDAAAVWVHNASAGYAGTGPRTDNRYGHNRKIRDLARSLPEGHKLVADGRLGLKEAVIPIPVGGIKQFRRPDLLVEAPDGTHYAINVGLLDAAGRPKSRELGAIDDLVRAGYPTIFVPYGAR